jgi:adenosyl cobinamide kinase/adenosyl cobinamide phosphate guanylyltransferase
MKFHNNIEFFIGPRSCGKSLAAETLVSHFARRKLYIGTLWKDPIYNQALHIHRIRRDESWDLFESTGSAINDTLNITDYLAKNQNVGACLIDGLTTWAIHNSTRHGSVLHGAMDVVDTIHCLLQTFPYLKWVFVDVAPESFCHREEILERLSCNYIRIKLVQSIKRVDVLYWR